MNHKSEYLERIIPGTKDFEENFAAHLNRYQFVKEILVSQKQVGKILEVGCGTGYGTAYLSDFLPGEYTGVDLDPTAINFAKTHYSKSANFEVMDVLNLKFKNSFDWVIALEILEHLEDQTQFIDQIKKVLKKSGGLIISTPNKNLISKSLKKPRNPYHKKELTLDQFIKLLNTFFPKVTVFGQYRNQAYQQRIKTIELLTRLVQLNNEIPFTIFRELVPQQLLRSLPQLFKTPLHRRVQIKTQQTNKEAEKMLSDLPNYLTLTDLTIDRFHLDQSEAFIAVCQNG